MRGAILCFHRQVHQFAIVSIRAPREGSDVLDGSKFTGIDVSIRAPREGSDLVQPSIMTQAAVVSIRVPVRGAMIFCSMVRGD